MKQILPVLFLLLNFLVFCFPQIIHAAISFQISNPVKEGDYVIVDASLSGIASTSAFVQGMFTATSSSNYFGFTWGQNEEWVNYVGSTTKEFIIQNFPILQRNISQKIWIRPDYSNSAYKGPGDYILKLKRYTGASDNSTGEDATVTVVLSEPLPTPIPTPTPEPTNTPESTPAVIATPNPTKTPTPTATKYPAPSPTLTLQISKIIKISPTLVSSASSTLAVSNFSTLSGGLVLGDSSDSSPDQVEVGAVHAPNSISNQIAFKYTFIFGVVVLSISGGILYFRHRND